MGIKNLRFDIYIRKTDNKRYYVFFEGRFIRLVSVDDDSPDIILKDDNQFFKEYTFTGYDEKHLVT